METSCSSCLPLARLSSGSLYPMLYGSCYVLNWLKLCIPRWKGAKAPLNVQGASGIHLVDNKDDLKIQEQLSIVQIFICVQVFTHVICLWQLLILFASPSLKLEVFLRRKEDQRKGGVTLTSMCQSSWVTPDTHGHTGARHQSSAAASRVDPMSDHCMVSPVTLCYALPQ